ncbi:MmgE/PrpD family protein [Defluviimonas sp. WL0024]|uniref:MmgE/PrpD family protein n=2 Tax=Albidovulum TaxID=205889 RepID=A0ABT3J9T4_9RHOB|nr:MULTISPECIES: MmgE/PrpD family protein [Defluviimonas]MCU9850333.1 MmgE/PrpD family protein [Defluviimonas sp. WL0024]MCW3784463.1 MmgE/PrpD family protein [Defluviimonas salinarum]
MSSKAVALDANADTFATLADFTLELSPEAIPASARERAALMLLDTLGICAAAAPMEAGVLGRRAALLLHASSDPGHSARMLFDGRIVSLAGAAYAAATQTDNLDGHDGYNPTKGHIGVVAVPALAVLAEHLPDLSGPEALAALIVGYEVAGRAGIALHATVSDYHTSGAWNTLGVAAMAARLRRQTPAMLREALGIAEYHGPRSQMMREIATPTMLHDGSGWGALVGMSAAILAENGFTGAPAITVEAANVAPHWADLGRFWQIEHQYVKPYPVCRWAHAAIDAARELALGHAFAADHIEKIRIRSFDYAVQLFPTMPDTTSKAQYSLPFAVATMLVQGHIGLDHISGEGLADPKVAALVGRTVMEASERHQARFPAGRWADVEITLADGRVLASGDTHARGGPERPFGRDEVVAKYKSFAVPALGEARAQGLCDAVLALTEAGSRFDAVARHLYDPL